MLESIIIDEIIKSAKGKRYEENIKGFLETFLNPFYYDDNFIKKVKVLKEIHQKTEKPREFDEIFAKITHYNRLVTKTLEAYQESEEDLKIILQTLIRIAEIVKDIEWVKKAVETFYESRELEGRSKVIIEIGSVSYWTKDPEEVKKEIMVLGDKRILKNLKKYKGLKEASIEATEAIIGTLVNTKKTKNKRLAEIVEQTRFVAESLGDKKILETVKYLQREGKTGGLINTIKETSYWTRDIEVVRAAVEVLDIYKKLGIGIEKVNGLGYHLADLVEEIKDSKKFTRILDILKSEDVLSLIQKYQQKIEGNYALMAIESTLKHTKVDIEGALKEVIDVLNLYKNKNWPKVAFIISKACYRSAVAPLRVSSKHIKKVTKTLRELYDKPKEFNEYADKWWPR